MEQAGIYTLQDGGCSLHARDSQMMLTPARTRHDVVPAAGSRRDETVGEDFMLEKTVADIDLIPLSFVAWSKVVAGHAVQSDTWNHRQFLDLGRQMLAGNSPTVGVPCRHGNIHGMQPSFNA